MAKKKILFIQTQAENAGAQEIARILALYLEKQNYEVSQVFLYRKTGSHDNLKNVYFCAESRPHTFSELFHLFSKLRKLITSLAPNEVITFQHYGNIIGGLSARICGVKSVIANQLSAPQTMSWPVRLIDGILGCLGTYTYIVVNSNDTYQEYARLPQRYAQKLVHIDHGFAHKKASLSKEEARTEFNLPANTPIIGCVARLHPLKRLDTLIHMIALQKSWHLVLAGQGEERQLLEALVRKLEVSSRVHFLGEKDPSEIGNVLATMDVFAFPSEAETFGLAAVEAAQAGIPVVAYALPVLREVLASQNGMPCAIFVEGHDPHLWAKNISHVLETPKIQTELSQRGKALAEKYSYEAMGEAYIKLLHTAQPTLQEKEQAWQS